MHMMEHIDIIRPYTEFGFKGGVLGNAHVGKDSEWLIK